MSSSSYFPLHFQGFRNLSIFLFQHIFNFSILHAKHNNDEKKAIFVKVSLLFTWKKDTHGVWCCEATKGLLSHATLMRDGWWKNIWKFCNVSWNKIIYFVWQMKIFLKDSQLLSARSRCECWKFFPPPNWVRNLRKFIFKWKIIILRVKGKCWVENIACSQHKLRTRLNLIRVKIQFWNVMKIN